MSFGKDAQIGALFILALAGLFLTFAGLPSWIDISMKLVIATIWIIVMLVGAGLVLK
jgi:hypothetical protein